MSIQQDVYNAVRDRGYTKKKDGSEWPPFYFESRQLIKSVDEAVEAMGALYGQAGVPGRFRSAGDFARLVFKSQDAQHPVLAPSAIARMTLLRECADIVIPILCLAESLRQENPSLPELLDVVAEKSAADVERGVSQ